MKTSKILIAFLVVVVLLVSQGGAVFAAPALLDEEEQQHPVAAALADYFSEITDYETIMEAHEEDGFGFGVIAQALWILLKVDDPQFTLQMVLDAKQNNDFSDFDDLFADDPTPHNWGQFRKAILNGDKHNNLGVVMSDKGQDHPNNGGGNGQDNNGGNGQGHGNSNHGNGNGQGNEHGNGHGHGNNMP